MAAEEAAIREGRRVFLATTAAYTTRRKANDVATAALGPEEVALREQRVAHVRSGRPHSAAKAAIDAEAIRLVAARRLVEAEAAALTTGEAAVRDGRRLLTARKLAVSRRRQVGDRERNELDARRAEVAARQAEADQQRLEAHNTEQREWQERRERQDRSRFPYR